MEACYHCNLTDNTTHTITLVNKYNPELATTTFDVCERCANAFLRFIKNLDEVRS